MIKKFSVQNYKCYDHNTYFDLPGLTLVSGTNNSGKSSFLQALNLLVQNKSRRYPVMTINGEMNLGSFSKILNKQASNKDTIKLSFALDADILNDSDFLFFECYYEYKSANEYNKLTIFGIEDYPVLDYMEVNYSLKDSPNYDGSFYSFKLIDLEDKYLYKITNHLDVIIGYCEMPNLMPMYTIYKDLEMTKSTFPPKELMKIRRLLLNIDSSKIHYIKALRLQDINSRHQLIDNQKIGISGEYTAEIIHRRWEQEIDFDNPEGNKLKFKEIFNSWIKIILGEQYSIYSKKVENDQYNIVIIDNYSKMEFSLDQVGFGISQILPIITMLLTSKTNDLILIENPEVHLHPKLQSLFIDLCIYVMKSKRTIVIETHSEHMVNRLRLNIKKDNEILPKTNIYFFGSSEYGPTYSKIEIDKMGRLANWPKDFFDQSYYDLLGLIDNE